MAAVQFSAMLSDELRLIAWRQFKEFTGKNLRGP